MSNISRRNLFRSILGRSTTAETPETKTAPTPKSVSEETPPLALILDRFCLAYQRSFCSVCSERCPVEGAITVVRGMPRVNPEICTGCKICHDVCPAPKNAVFLVDRKPRQGMVSRNTESDNS